MTNWYDLFNPPPWFWYMIVIDSIIAMVIPIYIWWHQIKKRAKELIAIIFPIVNSIYHRMKPQIERDIILMADKLIIKLKSEMNTIVQTNVNFISNDVQKKINTALTNDIPHLLEEKMKDSATDLIEKMGFAMDVKLAPFTADLRRNLSLAGVEGKSAKKAERELKEQLLIDSDPKMANTINKGKMAQKTMKFPMSTYDQGLDLLLYQQGQKAEKAGKEKLEKGGSSNGQSTTTSMPVLPGSPAPIAKRCSEVQKEMGAPASQKKEMEKAALNNAQAKKLLKSQISGMPPGVKQIMLDSIKEGDAKLANARGDVK